MGHDDHRLVGAVLLQCLEDACLGEGVEVAGGLIEQKQRRILQEDAGKAQALALAAGERVAQLGKLRVEALRQALHKLAQGRFLKRCHELFVARVCLGHEEVLADGGGKEERVLLHEALLAAQARGVHVVQVKAGDGHAAALRIPETHEELEQGRLAHATGPGDAHDAPGADVDIDVGENLLVAIGEAHLVHRHALKRTDVDAVGHLGRLRGLFEQVEHA